MANVYQQQARQTYEAEARKRDIVAAEPDIEGSTNDVETDWFDLDGFNFYVVSTWMAGFTGYDLDIMGWNGFRWKVVVSETGLTTHHDQRYQMTGYTRGKVRFKNPAGAGTCEMVEIGSV